jgi:hypothetical protein
MLLQLEVLMDEQQSGKPIVLDLSRLPTQAQRLSLKNAAKALFGGSHMTKGFSDFVLVN